MPGPNYAPAIDAFARSFIESQQRASQAQQITDAHLVEAAKTNPALWDEPRTKKAAESYYGKDAAPVVINAFKAASDPEHPAYEMLRSLNLLGADETVPTAAPNASPAAPSAAPGGGGVFSGIARGLGLGGGAEAPAPPAPAPAGPAPSPYAGSQQKLIERGPTLPGTTVSLGPKGATVSRVGPTQAQADEQRFYQAVGRHQRDLIEHGMAPAAALKQATMEGVSAADESNVLVPKQARDLASADTKLLIDRRTRTMQNQVDLAFAGPTAEARAKGEAVGGARGKAAAAMESATVTLASGETFQMPLTQIPQYAERMSNLAAAVTGVPGAVDFGKDPSKAQLSRAAAAGQDVVVDPAGNLIGIPVGVAPAVSAATVVQGPEALRMLGALGKKMVRFKNDKEFIGAFPSEAELGRIGGRSAGWLRSWTRKFSDSAKVLRMRGEVRQLGFQLARLLGSNSQLSDAERENAQAIWQPVIDGTGTREQVLEAIDGTSMLKDAIDARAAGKPEPPAPAEPPAATPNAADDLENFLKSKGF